MRRESDVQPGATDIESLVAEAGRLCASGRHRDAFQLCSGALRQHPTSARLWNAGAVAAMGLGLTEDAERFWQVAVRHDTDYAEAHYNLGVLYRQSGRLEEAASSLARTAVLDPAHASAFNNLGVVLFERGKHREALVMLKRATELDPANAEALNNLGLAQIELGQLEAARSALDRAVALRPDMATALNTRGLLQIEMGALDAGAQDFDAAIALQPDYGQAHLNRALIHRAEPGAPWVSRLEAAFGRRGSLPSQTAAPLAFAMGKVREDLGAFDAAFDAYAEGNRLHLATHPFDEAEDRRIVEALCSTFDRQVYAARPADEHMRTGEVMPRTPVFIVGMPRSGTSLLEQILASHPQVFGAGELTLLSELVAPLDPAAPPPADRDGWLRSLRELGTQYLSRAWDGRTSQPVLIDKMPGNHRHVGLIPLMLPRARIIHMMRDARDTCFSCFTTSFRHGHEYAYDLATLGRYYVRYERLMDHWRGVLPPGTLIDVRYEELVADIEGQSRRVLTHLGLPWDEGCLRFYEKDRPVSTASFAQVRQPTYSRSIGRWRRFERHLGPLLDALSTR